MKQKTIMFVVATSTRIGFVLKTDLFRKLESEGNKMVIVSPFWNDKNFKDEFSRNNIFLEPLPIRSRLAKAASTTRNVATQITDSEKLNRCKKIQQQITRRYRPQNKKINWRGPLLKVIPKKIKTSDTFWNHVEYFAHKQKGYTNLFKKYKPDVLVLASGGAEGEDIPFLLYSWKRKIPSIAIDGNIDVFEFRYFSKTRPITEWALFSEAQKEEGASMQKIPKENLKATGPLRYDYYFHEFKPENREKFLSRLGLDPNKKVITLGAKVPVLFPHNDDIIKIIKDAINDKKIDPESQLYIRFDPNHDPKIYDKNLLSGLKWELATSKEASTREHLANLLYHSDIVISISSTFSCEACLVDTPAAWIGFEGFASPKTLEESYRYAYELDLFKRILKTGGISLVESPKELINTINKYIKSKKEGREERKKFVLQEYYNDETSAGVKIAKLVNDLINRNEK
ncbi:MAG: hypothetical protein COU07_03080 [Candidatus Harrisonbacteria bacterium CG10_big_fil_rev_8_21_14_0_10_40_38]|uniref:UDP-glycosyltransferase n=1 Tax=Candidatus Harrisonbacteria bacterium CG10_big_fil_rev_8_21_14_0_10_40_38 TaxID=1974583 RepID=A0A2H0URL0_9BACT|nr:MAG: hypothetical protein COU07_03080 [Candidatus Harrisonbacteria bacterium CG10_big_fil_rev_8_21_14_0_10_40_38]